MFELKLAITKQAIHSLDRMLDVGRAWQAPAKAGQSQTLAAQQGGDATHQRGQALGVDIGECLGKCLV